MKNIKSCEFNMDTGCVELRFQDGSMISIDCTAVENEVADNRFRAVGAGLSHLQRPAGLCRPRSERRR